MVIGITDVTYPSSHLGPVAAFWQTLIANCTYSGRQAPDDYEQAFWAAVDVWGVAYTLFKGFLDVEEDGMTADSHHSWQPHEKVELGYDYIGAVYRGGHHRKLCI